MRTPVLMLIFNRPDTTRRVFEAVRRARPERLLVAADGPRPGRPGEAERCAEARRIVASGVDWPCELETLFRTENLGCRDAVGSALDWFFERVEAGIVLEDDCLPHPDFFRYAAAALDFYRDDERVMHINGSSFVPGVDCGGACAYFYRYAHVWGWAAWRRSWRCCDRELADFDPAEPARIFAGDPEQARRWRDILEKVRRRDPAFNTWDFQWSYAVMRRGGVALTPAVNLISNIGFEDATHRMDGLQSVRELASAALPETLIFPPPDAATRVEPERRIWQLFYRLPPWWRRAAAKLGRLVAAAGRRGRGRR